MRFSLSAADLYHTGVVVADVDEAAGRLSAVGGYHWTKTLQYTVPVITVEGAVDISFTMAYSLESPHIELIQEIPGTLWVSAPRNAVHHLGYWTDDVDATGKALEQSGYTLEARPNTDAPANFAFYLDPLGIRVELVGRVAFGGWTAFLESMAR